MSRKNCWEIKHCGREHGGARSKELGVCPAATLSVVNGINNGHNGGRACWAIAGTLCGGKVQGSFATKVANCMQCEFFRQVKTEEGAAYTDARGILQKI